MVILNTIVNATIHAKCVFAICLIFLIVIGVVALLVPVLVLVVLSSLERRMKPTETTYSHRDVAVGVKPCIASKHLSVIVIGNEMQPSRSPTLRISKTSTAVIGKNRAKGITTPYPTKRGETAAADGSFLHFGWIIPNHITTAKRAPTIICADKIRIICTKYSLFGATTSTWWCNRSNESAGERASSSPNIFSSNINLRISMTTQRFLY
mmetsp:Transcript_14946/g.19566  ORF Transcript_14946/g.19566 Transcript_14946/m.19566 type:complete len:209 (+) Transcript_14946:877-1503(+)